jgi:uncharacterized repeat protein (TIGR03803 family)
LTNVNGTLYGVTDDLGVDGYGTVFSVTTTGEKKVLYSFGGGSGGADPLAGLTNVNGTLYGTTYSGGSGCLSYGCGTVFSVTTTGTEKVLYSFSGASDGDGTEPFASLTNVNGTLYGTTAGGGVNGNGTVFSVTVAGEERVLYGFAGGSDGVQPWAALINVKGTLYGTTVGGGVNGYGTIFSVTTTGAERVRYSFDSGSDGAYPYAGLIKVNSTLYGTTSQGGGSGCSHSAGCGSVFAFTP